MLLEGKQLHHHHHQPGPSEVTSVLLAEQDTQAWVHTEKMLFHCPVMDWAQAGAQSDGYIGAWLVIGTDK